MLKYLFGTSNAQNKVSAADCLLARFETQFPCKSSSQQQEIAAYEIIFRARDQKKSCPKTLPPDRPK